MLLDDSSFVQDLKNAKHSVSDQFTLLRTRYSGKIAPTDMALCQLALRWRNGVTHFSRVPSVDKDVRVVIQAAGDYYFGAKNHLRVSAQGLLDSFDHGGPPSWQQQLVMFEAIGTVVKEFEQIAFREIDLEHYAERILRNHFRTRNEGLKRAGSVANKTGVERETVLRHVLCANGFRVSRATAPGPPCIGPNYLADYGSMRAGPFVERLTS